MTTYNAAILTAGVIDSHKEFSLTAQQMAALAQNAETILSGPEGEESQKIYRWTRHQSLRAIMRSQEVSSFRPKRPTESGFFHQRGFTAEEAPKRAKCDTIRIDCFPMDVDFLNSFREEASALTPPAVEVSQSAKPGLPYSYPTLEDGFLLFCFSFFATVAAFLGGELGAVFASEIGVSLLSGAAQFASIVFCGLSGGVAGLIFALVIVSAVENILAELAHYFSYRAFISAQRLTRSL